MTQTLPEPLAHTYITRLSNPYPGFKQGDPNVKRISMDIPVEAAKTIQRIRFDHGTIILAARMFIRCIVQEARDQGWSCENEREFEDFVLSRTQTTKEKEQNGTSARVSKTTLSDNDGRYYTSGPAEGQPLVEGRPSDDRAGASGVRQASSGTLHEPAAKRRKQTSSSVKE